MFSKLLCIVNISSYKKEQLKLHRSLLGVKRGGGGKTALTTFCRVLGQILVESTTQQILFENVHKIIINILSVFFSKTLGGGGGENNSVRSPISDQCYF